MKYLWWVFLGMFGLYCAMMLVLSGAAIWHSW